MELGCRLSGQAQGAERRQRLKALPTPLPTALNHTIFNVGRSVTSPLGGSAWSCGFQGTLRWSYEFGPWRSGPSGS